MTDMSKILARYKALLEPEGAGGNSPMRRDEVVRRVAPDSHAFLPGTWFMGGHHNGGEAVRRMWDAAKLMWPKGTRLFRNHFFVGEDTFLGEWWSRNRFWNGNACQNSGVGRLRFRDDLTIDHHEITDSEYFEEVHGAWRDFVGPELGQHLPRWHDREPPFYPDPANNDWNLEHSPTDGRNQAPPDMRERLARTIEWWRDPRNADDAVFDENFDVFFQGRLWPLGGHHRGRASLARLREVMDLLWPGPEQMVKTNFWANETRVAVEWFREARTWKGQAFREGGFTVWDWRDDRVEAVRTYVDTSLHAELTQGWREKLGSRLGKGLPNWPPAPKRRYPTTDFHE
jgi:ketosteroid isomerase-like protein